MTSDCDGTINRIRAFIEDKRAMELMTLHQFTQAVTMSGADARHLYRVIDTQNYHMDKQQTHTKYEWFNIADLSGMHPDWCGYMKSQTGTN